MDIKGKIVDLFHRKFGDLPQNLVLAPGRVNILGEHVDYNDGFVLPAAIDRATYIAFSPAEETHGRTCLIAADFDQRVEFTLESLATKSCADGSRLPDWARYPAGVA